MRTAITIGWQNNKPRIIGGPGQVTDQVNAVKRMVTNGDANGCERVMVITTDHPYKIARVKSKAMDEKKPQAKKSTKEQSV